MSPRAAGLRLPGAWRNVCTSCRAPRWRPEPEIDTPERRGGEDPGILAASRAFARVSILALSALLAGVHSATVLAQSVTPPGTQIRNYANLQFDRAPGVTDTVRSNEVITVVAPARSRAAIEFVRTVASGSGTPATSGPTACRVGNAYQPLANPVLIGGQTLDPAQAAPMAATGMYHGGEPFFIRLADLDRNRDAAALDVIDVRVRSVATGDSEILRLTETGPNAGEFVGYVPSAVGSAVAGDCVLQVARESDIRVDYVDPVDATDAVEASAALDPVGLVFNSQSGTAVDGARLRIVDAATGQPATVYGDDGVSVFPAEVVSGGQATDSGGTLYTFAPGSFRFPVVANAGMYRLVIEPPTSFAFPSTVGIAQLQLLPGAPFTVNAGSFGNGFAVASPPAANIDVPLDPTGSALIVDKTTPTAVAAVGDFIQYSVTVQNSGAAGAFPSVTTVDTLPAGTRYVRGSARINDAPAPDPTIDATGRRLTFVTGNLAPAEQLTIRYVVELTAAVHAKELTNDVQAIGFGNVASNKASATIRVRDELLRSAAIISGRVVEGDCPIDPATADGVEGVRVYLEDGRYAVTDKEGKYHFEGVTPGAHVVQMDTETIPPTLLPAQCAERARFAGRNYSQFVDLRGGALWRADFTLTRRPPPAGTVTLAMRTTVNAAANRLSVALPLAVSGVNVGKLRALVMLPAGIGYRKGSAQLDGAAIDDPGGTESVLSFDIGEAVAPWNKELRFEVEPHAGARGTLTVKAVAVFDTPTGSNQKTDPVENRIERGAAIQQSAHYVFVPRFDVLGTELTAADRAELDRIARDWRGVNDLRIRAVGHTDSTPISARNRGLYADNYELSLARARTVADYVREKLGLDAGQFEILGRGADEPVEAGKDPASLARNRRVEVNITGMKPVSDGTLTVTQGESTPAAVATRGIIVYGRLPGERNAEAPPIETSAEPGPVKLVPQVAWLTPAKDFNPPIPSLKVAIEHLYDQKVQLLVNGVRVSDVTFDGATASPDKTFAVSNWRGVQLAEGDNRLTAEVIDGAGQEVERLERDVHYSGGPVRAELLMAESTLIADGRTRPVIALRLFDNAGHPARRGTLGVFNVAPPYRSWWEVATLNDNQLVAVGNREPTYAVGDDGIARIELEPTSDTGTVVLNLRYNERQSQEIRAWLKPAARDWIMVGIAEGSGAYHTLSENMQAAEDAGREEGFDDHGRVAFFAKGRVKGEFLLTMAYDSDRDREAAQDRLHGIIEPDRYYTIYGDGSEQRFEAASQRKLYVKLERNQFVALFGDYDTGLNVTELTRYSRSMNGLRTEYGNERVGVVAFAARTDQTYVKDELPGDGTSGLYHLSRQPLVVGSDKLRIEVRDRFHSERVLETRTLARFLDYEIDYELGTLFFKEPVASRDNEFNPVIIVAEYETRTTSSDETTAGGRAALKFAQGKVEVGASFVSEGAATGDGKVGGADLRWTPVRGTELRAEMARSDSKDPARAPSADAYLIDLKHVSDRIEAHAYAREEEAGFGLGQQFGSEAGTRKAGLDGRVKLTDRWGLAAEAFRQEQLDTGADRTLAQGEVRYQTQTASLGLGLRHVADDNVGGEDERSQAGFATGSVDVLDGRVTLRGAVDATLNGEDSSIDYPQRATVGVDYHLRPDATIFAEYEHADGANLASDMTRVGVRATPWNRAQLRSSVTQETTEYGPRTFATAGLTQGWQINKHWALDAGIDQSNTLRDARTLPLNPNAPLASGTLNDDFFATYLGVLYRKTDWTFTSRAEWRNSDLEERLTYAAGVYREPVAGQAMSMTAFITRSDLTLGTDSLTSDVRFGWAYRPVGKRWMLLDRLDLLYDERSAEAGTDDSRRIVNNLNANWQLDERMQLGLQYGSRYARSTFDGVAYDGYSDLVGLDLRRDLNRRYDVGLHGTVLHSWDAQVAEYSVGIDVGVSFAKNVWISFGYNLTGFDDRDFSAARYTDQGPFIKLRIKADQDTFKDLGFDHPRAAGP
jgi:uncharacterized repeat protein (TIGR01451 family)